MTATNIFYNFVGFRGIEISSLLEFLDELKEKQFCITQFFDSQYWQTTESIPQPTSHNMPNIAGLKDTIATFKKSLH